MKITIVGSGNVGSSCANIISQKNIAKEIILLDIKNGIAEGKGLDIQQASCLSLSDTKTLGVTNNYEMTANSNITIITSGLTRKPGMSRDDLIITNANIVKNVTKNIIQYSPNTIIIVVSNPLDIMTYCSFITSKFSSNCVMGMAGILDKARYCNLIANTLNCSHKDISSIIVGSHGDTMVPLPRYTTVSGIPINELLTEVQINNIIEQTKLGGGELVKLMGMSAWQAPAYSVAQMVESIIYDQKRIFPCSVLLQGEYGLEDICIGVPVKLGVKGVEEIIELKLNEHEYSLLYKSSISIRNIINNLNM
ncbi:MAG: malate dehydrogenase [Bacteroides sp.]|nr:MAG: malate dehydrogenase [Bacteroides sp.]